MGTEASQEHVTPVEEVKDYHDLGCVTKHEGDFKEGNRCSYRWQGYVETVSVPAKKQLYELDFKNTADAARLDAQMPEEYKIGHKKLKENLQRIADPRKVASPWAFTGDNYKVNYKPFNINYHHILPYVSLKNALSLKGQSLLQKATYNLNGRPNMIILPCSRDIAYYLALPAHPYGHPLYNTAVKDVVKEIVKQVEKKKGPGGGHPELSDENAAALNARLIAWEQKEYWDLVGFGRTEAAAGRRAMVNDAPMASPEEAAS